MHYSGRGKLGADRIFSVVEVLIVQYTAGWLAGWVLG